MPGQESVGAGAKILMLHGAADVLVKPDGIAASEQSLNTGEFDWQWLSFGRAVHAYGNPGADAPGKANNIPIFHRETAARRSWQHMQRFFRELFAQ